MWKAIRKIVDAITFGKFHHLLDEGASKAAPDAEPKGKRAK